MNKQEKEQSRKRIMKTQSDYVHCDFIDSKGHECGQKARHFMGGISDKQGNINSFMLCGEHRHIFNRFNMVTALITSFGIGLLAVGLFLLLDKLDILKYDPIMLLIIYGLALFSLSLYGYKRANTTR